jgi:hypothetical protein
MKQFAGNVTRLLGSRRFFYVVLVFFAMESLWIAVSSRYPMAFDEDFHLGIIKIYSHHWLPFLSAQPENAAQYGALQHDPSYLYHYLMSFPYRLLTVITHSETAQIIALRIINIALAVWGVVLFRKVLVRAAISAPLTNLVLALFVLIPIVPLVAGQINYDNLLMPIVAFTCLLAYDVYTALAQRRIALRELVLLAIVCLLGSIVKYPYLPFVIAVGLFIAGTGLWHFRRHFKQLPKAIATGYAAIAPKMRIVLATALVISLGLFLQRYGTNVIKYHTPVPECDVVLSEAECTLYGPWGRNHAMELMSNMNKAPRWGPLDYTWYWLQALHYRSFFTVNGPQDSFRNYPPLPLPSGTAVLIVVSGLVALLLYGRRIFAAQPFLILFVLMILVYCGVLWMDDFGQYMETGQPVAINGRYLLPIFLLTGALFGRALSVALGRRAMFKAVAAIVVMAMFLQGGGLLSYILRSDELWYWPNRTVVHMNNGARRVVAPFVVEGSKYF